MLGSLVLGAGLYILTQLFWYSPFVAGQLWLRWGGRTEEESLREAAWENQKKHALGQVVMPAFLMSMAIHALYLVLIRLSTSAYILGVVGMILLSTLPKYVRSESRVTNVLRMHVLHDGALIVSLTLLGLFVLLSRSGVY